MSRCRRVWEVEAARDGRITGEDRQRVERHVASCADCEREQRMLAALGQELHALKVVGADELSVRRRRHELLSQADEERLAPARPARFRRALIAASALVALGLCGWFWYGSAHPRAKAPLAGREPQTSGLLVKAAPGARFQKHVEDGRAIVDLEHGRLTLIVNRAVRDRGVLVRTPDGEIEDVGTTFTVSVQDGHTDAIQVFEGRVFVRIAGYEARMLQPGEVYRPAPRTPLPEVTPLPRVVAEDREPPHPKGRRSHAAPTGNVDRPSPDPQVAGPADEYAEAFSAFEAGEMSRAAALFFQFEARHRDDVRAEDAAYLRLVALVRAGRAHEANFAARTYLQRYPNGFRARDVERLLTQ